MAEFGKLFMNSSFCIIDLSTEINSLNILMCICKTQIRKSMLNISYGLYKIYLIILVCFLPERFFKHNILKCHTWY